MLINLMKNQLSDKSDLDSDFTNAIILTNLINFLSNQNNQNIN